MTANRSIEAHLADHGIALDRGEGRPDQDPDGPAHTIDPNVDVLRVDRVSGGRRVPLGAWSTFANHGTVNHSTFPYYNADHHAARGARLRGRGAPRGRVPLGRPVVNVYGNSDAGYVPSLPGRLGFLYRIGWLEFYRFRHSCHCPTQANLFTRYIICNLYPLIFDAPPRGPRLTSPTYIHRAHPYTTVIMIRPR